MDRAKRPKNIATHPLGVRPSGNALLEVDNVDKLRVKTLGQFGVLSDELLMTIVQDLPKKDLLSLGHTSKAWFAYTWFDELWKQVVYDEKKEDLEWKGSWRCTALGITQDQQATVDASELVYSDFLHRPYEMSQIDYEAYIDPEAGGKSAIIPEYDEAEVTSELFDTKLYKKPFVTNLKEAIADWSIEDLIEKFGNVVFRQEYMDWPLKVYSEYVKHNIDETPLYLFDCRSKAHAELSFKTPLETVFGKTRDYFTLLGNERPDHQWLIVGPKRSGSSFHKDPNGTSAWNSVVTGRKYWIMFPGDSPPPGVWTDSDQSEVTAPSSLAEWFASGLYKAAIKSQGFCHAITKPGQVMYVPSGWWHAVVNLDTSIAMTGNFVAKPHLRYVMEFLRDKPDQISGFKACDNIYEKFFKLVENHDPETLESEVTSKTKQTWKELSQSKETTPFTFSFA